MAETTVESQAPNPGEGAAGARTNIGLLQRLEWVRGYLLMTPTILLMISLLLAPLGSLFLRSFWTQHGFEIDKTFTLHNYWELIAPSDEVTYWSGIPFPLKNPAYAIVIIKSLAISFAATIAVILIAYPMAYFLAFRVTRHKMLWLIVITIPFWTSYLLRVFAWKIILGYNGVINSGLIWLGVIDKPLEFLLYNPLSVVVTLAHAWVAYAILPIYVSLEKIDRSLLEAATDLGDRPFERFLHVTLPLSLPGVIASTLMVFIPTVGDYVTPSLVGGPTGVMVGNTIQSLFGQRNDGPLGAALSAVVMLIVTLIVCLFLWAVGYRKMQKREAQ
jgi:spermidine/putrescine transport system permease protein